MGMPNFENRTLFKGDNLPFLQGLNSESVDLIATDPPFNKSRDFHATPDSLAAGAKFTDRWRWEDDVQPEWVDAIQDDWPKAWWAIQAARETYGPDMAAFLCWLGVRLMECQRILKPTGSIYLHIDDTAQAYAKGLLDAIFGRDNFRNEIVWLRRQERHNLARKKMGRAHETIYWYAKSPAAGYNIQYTPLSEEYIESGYDKVDERGRYQTFPCTNETGGNKPYEFRGITRAWRFSKEHMEELYQQGLLVQARPGSPFRYKKYLADAEGVKLQDLWVDIPAARGKERTGYPTQKPLALYERIIRASSNPGDFVLDPFCGCATTPVAAERLGRQWIGMDLWEGCHDIIIDRLNGEKQIWRPEDVRLVTAPPERTDEADKAAPHLQQIELRQDRRPRFTKDQMKAILIKQWGAICWGCGFEPPKTNNRAQDADSRHFDLDHIDPKAEGGSNELDNRAILCRPCNGRKGDRMTLTALRRANKRDGFWYGNPPIDQRIDIRTARQWARDYLADAAEEGGGGGDG